MAQIYGDDSDNTYTLKTTPHTTNGADWVAGYGGNDRIVTAGGEDEISGGDGNDTLDGGSGADVMDGGDQDDVYYVDNLRDVAAELWDDALGGIDLVYAKADHGLGFGIENLTLVGTAGYIGRGNDLANLIKGNSGANNLFGAAGDDTLYGNGGNDQVVGGLGNDVAYGGDGDDMVSDLSGGGDNDLHGGKGNDHVGGGSGNDTLSGDQGADRLFGETGDDLMLGGAGNDVLVGSWGSDILVGGAGNDVFRYWSVEDSTPAAFDRLRASSDARAFEDGDRFDLALIDADTTQTGQQAFYWGGKIALDSHAYAGRLCASNDSNGDTLIRGNTDLDVDWEFQVAIEDGARDASWYQASDFI